MAEDCIACGHWQSRAREAEELLRRARSAAELWSGFGGRAYINPVYTDIWNQVAADIDTFLRAGGEVRAG